MARGLHYSLRALGGTLGAQWERERRETLFLMVPVALSVVPQIVFASYGGMLLAHGDSRRHFHLVMLTALLQVAFLFAGIWLFGVVGAVLAPGVAWLTAYPVISRYARIYNADDRWGEAVLLALGLGLNGYACYLHAADIAAWLP